MSERTTAGAEVNGSEPFAEAPGSGARCRECGKPATCYGEYEMCGEAYACDDCCGHGNEDGWCKPLPAPPNK